MKTLLINLIILMLSCNPTSSSLVEIDEPQEAEIIYAKTNVGAFELSLISSDGSCALTYKKLGVTAKEPEAALIKFDMASPCNFIRRPGKTSDPLEFTYGKNEKSGENEKRSVLMVVGGHPDRTRTDEFMPNGCGTQLQAVRVFDNVIEISRKINPGFYSTTCPSNGLDENFFAAVSSKEQ